MGPNPPKLGVCVVADGLDVSPIATVLVKNGHTHLMHWNKQVPDQWVGWGAKSWDVMTQKGVTGQRACMLSAL